MAEKEPERTNMHSDIEKLDKLLRLYVYFTDEETKWRLNPFNVSETSRNNQADGNIRARGELMADSKVEIEGPFEMPDLISEQRQTLIARLVQSIRDLINKILDENPSDQTVVSQMCEIAFRRGIAISAQELAQISNIAAMRNLNLGGTVGTDLLTTDRERDKFSTSAELPESSSVSESAGIDQEKQNHEQEVGKVTADTEKDAEMILKEITTEPDKLALGNPGASVSSEHESTIAAGNDKEANRRADEITLDRAEQLDKELIMDPVDEEKLKELKREEEIVAPQTDTMRENVAAGNTGAAISSEQESMTSAENDKEGNKSTDEIILDKAEQHEEEIKMDRVDEEKFQELKLDEEMVEHQQTDEKPNVVNPMDWIGTVSRTAPLPWRKLAPPLKIGATNNRTDKSVNQRKKPDTKNIYQERERKKQEAEKVTAIAQEEAQKKQETEKVTAIAREEARKKQEAEKFTAIARAEAQKKLKEPDRRAMRNTGAAVSSKQESKTVAKNNKEVIKRFDKIALHKAKEQEKVSRRLQRERTDEEKLQDKEQQREAFELSMKRKNKQQEKASRKVEYDARMKEKVNRKKTHKKQNKPADANPAETDPNGSKSCGSGSKCC